MSPRTKLTLAALALGLTCSSLASANETITYTYDARGRLIRVVHASSVSTINNNQACYSYDKADNRTNVKTTLGPGTPPSCP